MMKLKVIVWLFFACLVTKISAQSADDEYIGNLINQSDWFGLDEMYPKKKSGMQSEMLRELSEVMLSARFNEPDIALNRLDTLLTNHQTALGLDNVYNLIALKSRLYAEQGLYQEASENCSHFLNQLAAFSISKDGFPAHLFLEKYYEEIAYIPKPEIVRPALDVEVPLSIANVGKGKLMYIPVTVHGKEYRFLFNPGASSSFVSERVADEMNVHIVSDSIEIEGAGGMFGKCGAIDSIQIGDIVFKNMIVLIGEPGETTEAGFQVDAVLGLDFFRLVGETQIFPKQAKVVFPQKQTKLPKTGRNMMIENNQPYLKAYSGKERLVFHLDASNVNADLYYPYYEKYQTRIALEGTKEMIAIGSYDGAKMIDAYRLPQLPLRVGKKKFKLRQISVFAERNTELRQHEDGALGMDFITQFKRIVINFDKMFVEVK